MRYEKNNGLFQSINASAMRGYWETNAVRISSI